ncbi:dTDP-4-dehydrorhamnose reductase [Labrenzia sp. THAF82]|uniref:dTDP-4-dehydrorhamnose reductase n=1 Tax=Labrenzia sp. THAF82 TaxID=2587861 RepID=UPI001267E5AD|nr:dTDP-4-dehydrorhamnose reductase [Labrenzia sp. THAF82]QFT30540.1 dTDP-4-dehydrorhamnose reductase [Labrenzia sp. THAF82]
MTGTTRVLVTGKNGQLSKSLKVVSDTAADLEFCFFDRNTLDVTKAQSCSSMIDRLRPNFVLNLAAYTKVDDAERFPDNAHHVNGVGAGNLAQISAVNDIPIIHISTDYVFDGEKRSPYVETDRTNPVNAYGMSKLAGENSVSRLNPKHIVLRTAWLYSPFGSNFVSWLLSAAASGRQLRIVADQVGNPTSALDLAKSLADLVRQLEDVDWTSYSGIYHLAAPEPMTRFQWAKKVISVSGKLYGPTCQVCAAASSEFATPAVRPLRTVLSMDKYQNAFGLKFPPIEKSISDVLQALPRPRRDAH